MLCVPSEGDMPSEGAMVVAGWSKAGVAGVTGTGAVDCVS
jgi:hypothetical protein